MSQSSDRIAHKWIYAEPDESYDKASYNTSYIGDRFYSYNSVLMLDFGCITTQRLIDIVELDNLILSKL